MWSVVESKQAGSRQRKKSFIAKGVRVGVTPAHALAAPQQSVSSSVRDLRYAAQVLQSMAFVKRDVLSPLHHHLISHMDSLSNVHIVALGIGPFAREESRSGFLQMALLLVLQSACEKTLRKAEKSHAFIASTARSELDTSSAVSTSPREKPPILVTKFFDPATLDWHAECCAKLGVMVEKENRYGAYSPEGPHTLLIVYLPHSPWTLFRNLFASNVPRYGGSECGSCHTGQLRRMLVIGNDVRTRLGSSDHFMERLTPYLRFHEVRARDGGGDGGSNAESTDHHAPTGLKGIGRHDVVCAFSDTAVIQLNLEREAELSNALQQVRIPPIARGGPDLL